MKIDNHSVATVRYKVIDAKSGKILQETAENSQQFLIGYQLLLDVFENQLLGLEAGEAFRFVAQADEAYGPIDPHAIFDLPIGTFAEEDGTIDESIIQVGNVFPMADRDGNRHFGKIIRKMDQSVTMDFNHPLAGKELIFEGEVESVRPAQKADLPHEHSCGCHNHSQDTNHSEKSFFEH